MNKTEIEVSEEIIENLRQYVNLIEVLEKIDEIHDALVLDKDNENLRVQYFILAQRYNNLTNTQNYVPENPFYGENITDDLDDTLKSDDIDNDTDVEKITDVVIRKSRDISANDSSLLHLATTVLSNYRKMQHDDDINKVCKFNRVEMPNPDPTKNKQYMQQIKVKKNDIDAAKKLLKAHFNTKEFAKIDFHM